MWLGGRGLNELLGKEVGGSEPIGLPKLCDCLRQWTRGNEETMTADHLWCSC